MNNVNLNATCQPPGVRTSRKRAAATAVAAVVLGAILTTSARAEMYEVPSLRDGGVEARSQIVSTTISGTNTTVCWYGMNGWYRVEATTNLTDWFPVSDYFVVTDYSGCATVTNLDNPYQSFRMNHLNSYVGSGGCGGCHGDKYSQWHSTRHGSALATLSAIGMGANAGCLPCHTIGYGQPGGYTGTNTAQLSNVGCENCHGPAGWHKYSDHEVVHPAVTLDPKVCGGCHRDSHHPTYDEYETTLHAEVNDDIKYGAGEGVYYTNTVTIGTNTWYGYYVTTNGDGTLKTNGTTGIFHSGNGPGAVYDPGQDRQVGCGICHSAAARAMMLEDYEARLKGQTNALSFHSAKEAGEWSATCVTCHDPHGSHSVTNVVSTTNGFVTNITVFPAQLRYPTRSTNYYTMPTTADKRTIISTNFQGQIKTNVVFYSAAFANMFNPNIQVCGQCHNSRGARWDGRSYGYYITNTLQSVTTNGPGIAWGVQTNSSLSRPPHHAVQYNVLIGIVQDDYFNTNSSGVATNWIQRHGAGVSSSGVYNTNGCATCHVPSYSVSSTTNVTGHTFKMDTKGCTTTGCHGSVPNYEETQVSVTNGITRVVSLLNQWAVSAAPAVLRTNYGLLSWEYTTAGILGNPTGNSAIVGPPAAKDTKKAASVTNANLQAVIPDPIKQARFNVYMLLHDGSLGVHNPKYASALIADAESKVLNQFTLANFKAYTVSGFAPLNVGFTNLGTGVTGYNWSFGDGNTSTVATPTNTYASSGVYSVTLTANNGVSSETVTRTNYITVSTKPTVSFTADTTSGPTPLTVNFTNTSTSTNDVTAWRWTINGVNISTTDASYTFTNAYTTNVSYTILLRATTPAGNVTKTNTAYITVTP